MSEIKLLPCPFCGEETIYRISREAYLGTVIPQLFCNSCKMIIEVENDSPYLNDDKTYDYLEEKLYRQFNTRKPMQEIVERLEEKKNSFHGGTLQENYYWSGIEEAIEIVRKYKNE